MLQELKQMFSIKGSFSFFYDMEEILGEGYMYSFYQEHLEYTDTAQDLASALVDLLDDERESIFAYWYDAGLTEEEADQMFGELQEKLALVEIGN